VRDKCAGVFSGLAGAVHQQISATTYDARKAERVISICLHKSSLHPGQLRETMCSISSRDHYLPAIPHKTLVTAQPTAPVPPKITALFTVTH
jgi:hypothetical protein